MAKTRLKQSTRECILKWMKQEKINNSTEKNDVLSAIKAVCGASNEILIKEFPASDMEILRKHKCVRYDYCLRFSLPEGGDVFGFNVPYEYQKDCGLMEIAYNNGCYIG